MKFGDITMRKFVETCENADNCRKCPLNQGRGYLLCYLIESFRLSPELLEKEVNIP